WIPIALGGASPTASVIAVAPKVDERTRTVDVVYALNDTTPAMRVGGLVEVALPTGDDFEGVVVPRSAIVDREGKSVVYVQVDGEHFAERLVRVGPRAGGRVGIVSGLAVEERVVTEGAHLVRLAQSAAGEPAHGHIH
ncbi:MAG: efflux RND transporter periplasmic adaptor subunit, partial [Deltaproteobacteria bacterium]